MSSEEGAPDALAHMVIVKNTFIDLDDAPRKPILARYASMPAKLVQEDHEEEDSEEEGTVSSSVKEKDGASCPADAPPPPPAPELYRVATYDEYEDEKQWEWTQKEDKSTGGYSSVPGPGAAGPVAGPAGAIGNPMAMPIPGTAYVMVPAEMAIGVPTPTPMPDGMAPSQRFDRWPNGIPAPPTQAPEVGEAGDHQPKSPCPDKDPVVMPAIARPPEPRAPVLQRAFSVNSSIFRIHWTVDARVLKSSDREKVSPPFEVSMGGQEIQFKMCLRPLVTSESRGGSSFRKAKGKGTVDLRCLNELDPKISCTMAFRVAVGKGSESHKVSPTVRHDFSQKAICPLPETDEEWDFKTVVDEDSQTFVLVLEVVGG